MSKSETKARVGEDVSPADELKTAISGFMSDFKDFSSGVNAKFQKQDDRMNKLDRKTVMTARSALATSAHVDAPHHRNGCRLGHRNSRVCGNWTAMQLLIWFTPWVLNIAPTGRLL